MQFQYANAQRILIVHKEQDCNQVQNLLEQTFYPDGVRIIKEESITVETECTSDGDRACYKVANGEYSDGDSLIVSKKDVDTISDANTLVTLYKWAKTYNLAIMVTKHLFDNTVVFVETIGDVNISNKSKQNYDDKWPFPAVWVHNDGDVACTMGLHTGNLQIINDTEAEESQDNTNELTRMLYDSYSKSVNERTMSSAVKAAIKASKEKSNEKGGLTDAESKETFASSLVSWLKANNYDVMPSLHEIERAIEDTKIPEEKTQRIIGELSSDGAEQPVEGFVDNPAGVERAEGGKVEANVAVAEFVDNTAGVESVEGGKAEENVAVELTDDVGAVANNEASVPLVFRTSPGSDSYKLSNGGAVATRVEVTEDTQFHGIIAGHPIKDGQSHWELEVVSNDKESEPNFGRWGFGVCKPDSDPTAWDPHNAWVMMQDNNGLNLEGVEDDPRWFVVAVDSDKGTFSPQKKLGADSTIGLLLDLEAGTLSMSLGGMAYSQIARNLKGPLLPCIILASKNMSVKISSRSRKPGHLNVAQGGRSDDEKLNVAHDDTVAQTTTNEAADDEIFANAVNNAVEQIQKILHEDTVARAAEKEKAQADAAAQAAADKLAKKRAEEEAQEKAAEKEITELQGTLNSLQANNGALEAQMAKTQDEVARNATVSNANAKQLQDLQREISDEGATFEDTQVRLAQIADAHSENSAFTRTLRALQQSITENLSAIQKISTAVDALSTKVDVCATKDDLNQLWEHTRQAIAESKDTADLQQTLEAIVDGHVNTTVTQELKRINEKIERFIILKGAPLPATSAPGYTRAAALGGSRHLSPATSAPNYTRAATSAFYNEENARNVVPEIQLSGTTALGGSRHLSPAEKAAIRKKKRTDTRLRKEKAAAQAKTGN